MKLTLSIKGSPVETRILDTEGIYIRDNIEKKEPHYYNCSKKLILMPGTIKLEFAKEIVRTATWKTPSGRSVIIDTWKTQCGPNWRHCTIIITIDEEPKVVKGWVNVKTKKQFREKVRYAKTTQGIINRK